MRNLSFIFLFLAITSCLSNQKKDVKSTKKITVIAHRGASAYVPEHTLASKVMAHAMQADYIEQDIVLSKDDVPIVIHDILLDDVTNVSERYPARKREDGQYYVIDFTFEEIKISSLKMPKLGEMCPNSRGNAPKLSQKRHSRSLV